MSAFGGKADVIVGKADIAPARGDVDSEARFGGAFHASKILTYR